jgi:hypothetical protein
MLEIDHKYLIRAATSYVNRHGPVREPDELAKDLAQAAALRLIQIEDKRRVKFETMTAFQDEYCRWRFGVTSNQRERRLKIQDNDFDLDLLVDSRTPERIVMSRECIGKLLTCDDGRAKKYDIKGSKQKRAAVYLDMLSSGSINIVGLSSRSYSGSLMQDAKKAGRIIFNSCVEEVI